MIEQIVYWLAIIAISVAAFQWGRFVIWSRAGNVDDRGDGGYAFAAYYARKSAIQWSFASAALWAGWLIFR